MLSKVILILLLLISFPDCYSQGCLDAGEEKPLKITGFIQAQYEYIYERQEDRSSFTFNRVRLAALGRVSREVKFYLVMETSPFKEKAPYLLDAYISYDRFEPYASLILGQFKSPFSLEQNTGCAALHTIIRAKIVDELGAPQRDIGAMIYGNPVSFAEFWVAVMNGTGRGEADDNKNKHLIGRLVVQPFAPLRIGGSCRYGTSPSAVQGNTEESKHIRYSLETQIEYAGMLFQGEYIYGRDEGINLGGG